MGRFLKLAAVIVFAVAVVVLVFVESANTADGLAIVATGLALATAGDLVDGG